MCDCLKSFNVRTVFSVFKQMWRELINLCYAVTLSPGGPAKTVLSFLGMPLLITRLKDPQSFMIHSLSARQSSNRCLRSREHSRSSSVFWLITNPELSFNVHYSAKLIYNYISKLFVKTFLEPEAQAELITKFSHLSLSALVRSKVHTITPGV